ncbi:MAG: diguanylate cyclase [Candidatus Brocadiales bacterium]|nr:diguanylate cyclase [Candidatus Brocadiales bacterium]
MKINNKILFWFLVIAIIPSGITGFFGYQIAQDTLKKYVYNQLSITADGIHDKIHCFLQIKKERIIDFSSDGFIRNQTDRLGYSDNKDSLVADLNRHLFENKTTLDTDILETFILNMHGEVVASSNPRHVGLKRSDADYFAGVKNRDVFITDLHKCMDADMLVIEVSRLLTERKNGKLESVGVVVNRVKGISIADLLVKNTTGRETILVKDSNLRTYIINNNNQVVAGSNVHENRMLDMVINTEPVTKFRETGEEIIGVYRNHFGNQVFGVSIYDCHMGCLILVEEDVETVFADVKYLRNYAIVMKIITVIIVILLAFYISRTLTSPIKSLLEGTKRLREGMLGHRISITTRDEVGELANSFNTMADLIQERTVIINRTKDYLENVLDNTHDLVITTNTDGLITEFNAGAEQMLGYKREEVILRSADLFYLEKSKKMQLIKRLVNEGSVTNYETILQTKQGNGICMLITITQLKDKTGDVIGTVQTGKDITDRKELEKELKSKNIELEKLSITDALTGLYNKRHLFAELEKEIDRARRQGYPLSMILFDIDKFKKYNDTYGHPKGDVVLQKIGELVQDLIRCNVDSGYRYGGEEFIIILPQSIEKDAINTAERIRQSFEECGFTLRLLSGNLTRNNMTLSLGVCELEDDYDISEFIVRADTLMYRSKNLGGNTISAMTDSIIN